MEQLNNMYEAIVNLNWTRIFSFVVIGILIFGSLYQRNWNLSSKDKITLPNKKKVSRRLINTLLVFIFCLISLIISIILF
ncbi:hypothetical protein FK004_11660 [Flavobacterium kingsejongi]|uniref:Uncharacterized protein n=1 Tax=Flavobacterium kingsejongi TaxID=1678728 RepID=A0A2S1LQ00_9FLAO|nr:hypothetical protein FK004_11660 [Flavobacterium kingsejongi]